MSRENCLVVPTAQVVEAGLIPQDWQSRELFINLSEIGGLEKINSLMAQYGEIRPRYGKNGIEGNPAYQQFIMYAFATSDETVLVYQRDTSGKYSDNRLTGKFSIGIGGHIKSIDNKNLEFSLLRELNEEAQINGTWEDVDIVPLALVKNGDAVGLVHLGIVCEIKSKRKNIRVTLKTGEGEEAVKSSYMSLKEYDQIVAKKEVFPEVWTSLIVERVIRPLWQK